MTFLTININVHAPPQVVAFLSAIPSRSTDTNAVAQVAVATANAGVRSPEPESWKGTGTKALGL